MASREKLIARFKRRPSDFTWKELTRLLGGLGYELARSGKTGGSRRRFVHPTGPTISLHEPHPSTVVKRYVVHEVLRILTDEGMI